MLQQGIENPPFSGFDFRGKLSQPEIRPNLRPLSRRPLSWQPEDEATDPDGEGVTYYFGGLAYLQVFFHPGIIESVDCGFYHGSFFAEDEDGKTILCLDDLFEECVEAIERLLGILCEVGVTSTVYAFLTLVNSAGITLSVKRQLKLKHLNGLSVKKQDCKAELDIWCDAVSSRADALNVSLNIVSALGSCASSKK
jgi:hypothetical protein